MTGINILSIDWDYYLKASMRERVTLFPDTPNDYLPQDLQQIIWSGLYANDRLGLIDCNMGDIRLTKQVFDQSGHDTFTAVCCDHKYLYYHIHNYVNNLVNMSCVKNTDEVELNLINVDFHHDIYDSNLSKIDSGNWLRHIMDEFKGHYQWICRTDSDMPDDMHDLDISHDIGKIAGRDYDIIFICRSDMWSPPHLDRNFMDMISPLKNRGIKFIQKYNNIKLPLRDRYPKIKSDAEIIKSTYDKFMPQIKEDD